MSDLPEITVILEHRLGTVDWPTIGVFEDRTDAEAVCRWLNSTNSTQYYVRSRPFLAAAIGDTE